MAIGIKESWIKFQQFCVVMLIFFVPGLQGVNFSDFYFKLEPVNVIVNRGDAAIFHCAVNFRPSLPNVRWMKDGVYIDLNNDSRYTKLLNGSLVISSVRHSRSGEDSDSGDYQCVASIDGGKIVSRKAKLIISYINKDFDIEPHDSQVYLGDVAMFRCKIDGLPAPNITWYKDGAVLKPLKDNIRVYNEGVLEIDPVTFSDYGEYYCTAENSDKIRERSSSTARLTQNADIDQINQGIAPSFVLRPSDTRAEEGTTIILFCGANGQEKEGVKPTISWLKDGQTIDFSLTSGRLTVVGAGSLQIYNIREDDDGFYSCRAENSIDSEDADASLTVQVPPRFIQQPRNLEAMVRQDVLFTCNIYGIPQPRIHWLKNSRDLDMSDGYFQIVDGQYLRVLGLLKSDEGFYQCFGENELGNIQSSAELIVSEQDGGAHNSFTRPIHPSGGFFGGNYPTEPRDLAARIVSKRFVTLSWSPPSSGEEDIIAYSVYWKEQNSERERVLNTTQHEANIQHLKPGTVYHFRLQAYNNHGPSATFARVTVTTDKDIDVPSAVRDVIILPRSPDTIQLSWQPPTETKGSIIKYVVIYYEVNSNGDEQRQEAFDLSTTVTSLKSFVEYSFRIVAYNENGEGSSSVEYTTRTFSSRPTDTPQNVTLEASSSTSIIVKWEPPPVDQQNGIITGYKIKYRKREKGNARSKTVTTDGNRRLYALIDLEKNTEYQVKIAALNVNGTGPYTNKLRSLTLVDDLKEDQVPLAPKRIMLTPYADSIRVIWTPPPADSKIMVRGYILGYGRGVPDTYKHMLNAEQLLYTIKDLQPNAQYVVTVRAFNNMGEGEPRYHTAMTNQEPVDEPATPMVPPIGLKTIVLSSSTVVLTWSDTNLGQSQTITDNRNYTIRYAPLPNNNKKYKFINSSDLNVHIDNLKPNTRYEFSVKVNKGRRASPWSLSDVNTTQEAAPSSPPRDLTPISKEGDSTAVTLNWQPPAKPNGLITGYILFYTTDHTQSDRFWAVEGFLGHILSTTVKGLTPNTVYYFKIQARNSKGYGPLSKTVVYQTPQVDGAGGGKIHSFGPELPLHPDLPDFPDMPDVSNLPPIKGRNNEGQSSNQESDKEKSGGISMNLVIIIVSCVVGLSLIVVFIVVAVFVCRRCDNGDRNKRQQQTQQSPSKTKPPMRDLKKPDLWVDHDQLNLEMKNVEKPERSDSMMTMSTIRRNSCDGGKSLDDLPPYRPDLDKQYPEITYHPQRLAHDDRYTPMKQGMVLPKSTKPMMMSVDPQPSRDAMVMQMGPGIDSSHLLPNSRPGFPRTQYNMQYTSVSRLGADSPQQMHGNPLDYAYKSTPLDERMHGPHEPLLEEYSRIGYGIKSPSLPHLGKFDMPRSNKVPQPTAVVTPGKKRDAGEPIYRSLPRKSPHSNISMRSFSTSSPPLPHEMPSPSSLSPKHHFVKPQQSSSPYKKPTPPISSIPIKPRTMPLITSPKAPDVILKGDDSIERQKSVSTEELTAEMANLDCLMKDLNAITQQDFKC